MATWDTKVTELKCSGCSDLVIFIHGANLPASAFRPIQHCPRCSKNG